MCLRAEVKWNGVYSAAHPMANTESRGRASEDQSCREKGQQLCTAFSTLVIDTVVMWSRFVAIGRRLILGEPFLDCSISSITRVTEWI